MIKYGSSQCAYGTVFIKRKSMSTAKARVRSVQGSTRLVSLAVVCQVRTRRSAWLPSPSLTLEEEGKLGISVWQERQGPSFRQYVCSEIIPQPFIAALAGSFLPSSGEHLQKNISAAYNNLDVSFASFPSDTTTHDPESYKAAIDALSPGDAITIFTPDTTHYPVALYAIQHGIHVLITKPAVKHLAEHQELLREARKNKVFVFIEHHKRFDPAYADARARAKTLGEFNYFYSYMSQPKSQLETFKAWAGKDSDISYYLNSHHVDICESMVPEYKPVKVTASGSKGTAEDLGCVPGTEDTISLLVEWEKRNESRRRATAVYTASWTAPQRAGVHSNQYFHCEMI